MARVSNWNERIETAESGHRALTAAVSFLLAQIKRKAESRPEDAEEARRHCAREIAKLANSVTARRAAATRGGGHGG